MIFRASMVPRFARAMWHVFLYWRAGKPVIAPVPVQHARKLECYLCPQNSHEAWAQCRICLCAIEPKILLSSESCPIGKWIALENAPE